MSYYQPGMLASLATAGSWSPTGGTFPTVTNDGVSTTYEKKTSTGSGDYLTMSCADITFPTNEAILECRWRAQLYTKASAAISLVEWYSSGDASYGTETSIGSNNGIISSYYGVYQGTKLKGGGAWTQAAVNALGIRYKDKSTSSSLNSWLVECGLDIHTTSIPVAPTVSAPSGSITDTTTPPIVWVHNDLSVATITTKALTSNVATITTSAAHGFQVGNDVIVSGVDATFNSVGTWKILSVTSTQFTYAVVAANVGSTGSSGTASIGDGAAQAAYQARVFTDAVHAGGGFNPATSIAVYDTGVQLGSGGTATPISLTNGTTYWAYVITAKAAGGTYYWSPWGFSSFSISVTGPPNPTITASWDATNMRSVVAVNTFANMLSADDASAETTQGTWTGALNCTVTRSTTYASIGSASVRLSSTAAGDMWGATGTNYAVKGSTQYTARCDVRTGVSARSTSVYIFFYDASNANVGFTGGTSTNDTTSFVARSVTVTSPPTAVWAQVVVVVLATGGAAELHYIDKIDLHPGSGTGWTPGGGVPSATLTRTISGVGDTVRGANPLILDAGGAATVYDYDVPRGVTVTYSVIAAITISGSLIGTPSVAASPFATATDGRWWLKATGQPALNIGRALVEKGSTAQTIDETLAVFRPLGRSTAVVVASDVYGLDGSMMLTSVGAVEHAAMEALVKYQGALLLQEPWLDTSGVGKQRYVRVVSRSVAAVLGNRRSWKIDFVEVDRGYV